MAEKLTPTQRYKLLQKVEDPKVSSAVRDQLRGMLQADDDVRRVPAKDLGIPKEGGPAPEVPGLLKAAGQRLIMSDLPEGTDKIPGKRMLSTATGSIAGALAGATLGGPIPAALGGVGGAIAGTAFPEAAMEIMEKLKLLAPGTRKLKGLKPDDLRTVVRGEGAIDAITGGIPLLSLATRAPIRRHILGVTPEALSEARAGALMTGVEGDIMRVTNEGVRGGTIRGLYSVFARFPLLGAGFTQSLKRVTQQTEQFNADTVARFGPAHPITERGVRMLKATKGIVGARKKWFNEQYRTIRAVAESEGAYFPPVGAQREAREIVAEIASSKGQSFTGAAGKAAKAGDTAKLEKLQAKGKAKTAPTEAATQTKELDDFLRNEVMTVDPDRMGYAAFNDLMTKIDERLYQFTTEGKGKAVEKLTRVRVALRADMDNTVNASEGLRNLIKGTNTKYHEFMDLLERPAGQKMGSTQRHGLGNFAFDTPTRLAEDELFETAFKGQPPTVWRDLHTLLGPTVFKDTLSGHLDDAFRKAWTKTVNKAGKTSMVFNVDAFKEAAGLVPKTRAYESLRTALQLTGKTSIKDMEFMADHIAKMWRVAPIDPADFVARRAVLTGFAGIANAFMVTVAPGPSATTTALTTVATFLTIRSMGRALTNPALLRTFRETAKADGKGVRNFIAATQFLRTAEATMNDPEFTQTVRNARAVVLRQFKGWSDPNGPQQVN